MLVRWRLDIWFPVDERPDAGPAVHGVAPGYVLHRRRARCRAHGVRAPAPCRVWTTTRYATAPSFSLTFCGESRIWSPWLLGLTLIDVWEGAQTWRLVELTRAQLFCKQRILGRTSSGRSLFWSEETDSATQRLLFRQQEFCTCERQTTTQAVNGPSYQIKDERMKIALSKDLLRPLLDGKKLIWSVQSWGNHTRIQWILFNFVAVPTLRLTQVQVMTSPSKMAVLWAWYHIRWVWVPSKTLDTSKLQDSQQAVQCCKETKRFILVCRSEDSCRGFSRSCRLPKRLTSAQLVPRLWVIVKGGTKKNFLKHYCCSENNVLYRWTRWRPVLCFRKEKVAARTVIRESWLVCGLALLWTPLETLRNHGNSARVYRREVSTWRQKQWMWLFAEITPVCDVFMSWFVVTGMVQIFVEMHVIFPGDLCHKSSAEPVSWTCAMVYLLVLSSLSK